MDGIVGMCQPCRSYSTVQGYRGTKNATGGAVRRGAELLLGLGLGAPFPFLCLAGRSTLGLTRRTLRLEFLSDGGRILWWIARHKRGRGRRRRRGKQQ